MTYIDALNRLWELSMTYTSKEFTLSDYGVMCGILQMWNSIKRPVKFQLDYNVVMHGTKASSKTYYKSLKRLEKLGMFKYTAGTNQYCYGIIDFSKSALVKIPKQYPSGTEGEPKQYPSGTEGEPKQYPSDTTIITEYRGKSSEKEREEFLSSSSVSRARENDNDTRKKSGNDLQVVTDDGFSGNSPPVAAAPPSLKEVADYMESQGLYASQAQEEAKKFVNKNMASGWRFRNGGMIYDWKPVANNWMVKINKYEQGNSENGQSLSGPQYTPDHILDKLYD